MPNQIRQSELRNDNAAIMRRVAAGEAFVVTVRGHPVADVTPHTDATAKRRYVSAGEFADALAQTSAPDPDAWLADIADDAFAADEPSDPYASR